MDNDGSMEIVFGNSSGKLYIISDDGTRELAYTLLGFIEGAPALVDVDGDQDLEVIFTTTTTSGGHVYVIHHNGITMSGFPKEIGSMWAGPAVQDLDNDGVVDEFDTDDDNDGILDENDMDDDNDGIDDENDRCPGTPIGEFIDEEGCSASQILDEITLSLIHI